jgi:hypothetical protein
MSTLKEQLAKRTYLQHRLAVYEAIYRWLDDNFIPRDGRTPAKALRVTDCLDEIVPEKAIEEVLQWLSSGPIAAFTNELSVLENSSIIVEVPQGGTHGKAPS